MESRCAPYILVLQSASNVIYAKMKNNRLQTQDPDHTTWKLFPEYTLPQILMHQADRFGKDHIAIRSKSYGIWQSLTWSDYLNYTKKTALGLKTLGIQRNDKVGLMVDNDPEWLFGELGAQSMGAVTVNFFTSSIAQEISNILKQIKAGFVIVQDQEQVDKLLSVQQELPHIKKIVYIDPTGLRTYRDDSRLISFADLLKLGEKAMVEQPALFERELGQGKAGDIAHMLMTSGTTGQSKLVMLSHSNYTDMALKWLETASIGVGSNWISISPPAWVVDQVWGVGITLIGGLSINFPENFETIEEDFREIGPDIIITSSLFWENLASKIRVKINDAGFIKRFLYHWAQKIGAKVIQRKTDKKKPWLGLIVLHWIASRLVSRPLLDRIGCLGFKEAYTGGHPISPDVIQFFRINGLNLKQCYGMTETCGIFQAQSDHQVKSETVGLSLPRTKIKITGDQEVLVKSPSIFQGYYQNPEATAEALKDGWFHTGDAGYLDDDGHLVIIGRKQDIMHTKDGEPFSPDFIETRLKFSPYIKEAVLWGEEKPYLSAFINIDFGNVGSWAEDQKIPYTTYLDLSKQPKVEQLIQGQVQMVNKNLPKPMRLVKIILLYKLLDADDQELTRTGKIRREFVSTQYQNLIEAFYSEKTELPVKGQVNYRDGTVGIIESTVKILTISDSF